MKIQLIAVGKGMPAWVKSGFHEYAKRLSGHCCLQLDEINASERHKNSTISQLMDKEAKHILATIGKNHHVVALDVKGSAWSTPQLAEKLQQWQLDAHNVSLLVGGPDGLSEECLERSHESWSLSPLTLPHSLVRIIIAEQIYRAWSLLNKHPYHRE